MKRYIIILSTGILLAQDINSDTFSESSGAKGSVGTVTINGQVYNQLSLRPEIPFGKLGIGLDLYLYFNDDGLYWKSWDFSDFASTYRTIIDKIYYLRWGHPGDDLYILAGALPLATLGQGILVNNYSNIMEYPQVRQIGLNLQANIAVVDIELIHSNFKSATPGLIGLRGSYSILPKLNLGASYVTDLDQNAGLQDRDGDSFPDIYDFFPDDETKYDNKQNLLKDYSSSHQNDSTGFSQWYYQESGHANDYDPTNAPKDQISGFALDATYVLTKKITLYSEYAMLIGDIDTSMTAGSSYNNWLINHSLEDISLGWGFIPIGVKAKLGPINLLAEYRIGSRRFVFNYWDRSYDLNRISVSADQPITRESRLYQFGELNGIYAQTNMSVMDFVNLGIGYQNMQGEKWNEIAGQYKTGESNQTFLITLEINPALIPKVGKAEAFYQQSNVPNPFKFTPNTSTIWGYNIGVEISSGVMLLYQTRTTYILNKLGEFEPVKFLQIETQFGF